jgi:antirestriction protein ArdC
LDSRKIDQARSKQEASKKQASKKQARSKQEASKKQYSTSTVHVINRNLFHAAVLSAYVRLLDSHKIDQARQASNTQQANQQLSQNRPSKTSKQHATSKPTTQLFAQYNRLSSVPCRSLFCN